MSPITRPVLSFVALTGFLISAACAQAGSVNQSIDTVLGDHARYEPVIRQFQAAVVARDANAVAALVHYPITVQLGGKRVVLRSAEAFVPRYAEIVTPAVEHVVAAQKYDELMVNAQGVMFGQGEAWVSGICLDKACKRVDVKVITLQPAP